MRLSGLAALAAALAFTLAAGAADAAQTKRQRSASAPNQNSMTEQLNAESLQRAQAGQNAPTGGSDTTSNLNRMSQQDATKGKNMNTAPMPFR
jgi:hypothetical protein